MRSRVKVQGVKLPSKLLVEKSGISGIDGIFVFSVVLLELAGEGETISFSKWLI